MHVCKGAHARICVFVSVCMSARMCACVCTRLPVRARACAREDAYVYACVECACELAYVRICAWACVRA